MAVVPYYFGNGCGDDSSAVKRCLYDALKDIELFAPYPQEKNLIIEALDKILKVPNSGFNAYFQGEDDVCFDIDYTNDICRDKYDPTEYKLYDTRSGTLWFYYGTSRKNPHVTSIRVQWYKELFLLNDYANNINRKSQYSIDEYWVHLYDNRVLSFIVQGYDRVTLRTIESMK